MTRRQLIGAAVAAVIGAGIAVVARSREVFAAVPLLPDPFDLGDGSSDMVEAWDVVHGISDYGVSLIKSFEGLRLESYQDSGGVWTIGYGHTGPDVGAGQRITAARAEELLRDDVAHAEATVNAMVTAPITQNQYDALVSLVFNIGSGNFSRSQLLAKLNAGDAAGAAAEFSEWITAKGVALGGLVARRAQEANLFRSGMVS